MPNTLESFRIYILVFSLFCLAVPGKFSKIWNSLNRKIFMKSSPSWSGTLVLIRSIPQAQIHTLKKISHFKMLLFNLITNSVMADVFIAVNSPDCWPSQTLTPKNADLFADYYYVAAPVMNSIRPTAPILKRQAGSGRPPPPPTGSGLPNGANGGPGSGFPGGNPPPQGGNGLGMPPPVTIGCFPSVTNPGTYSNWQNTSSGLQFQDQCNSVTCDTGCKVISSVSNKCGSPYQVPDPKLSSR